VYKHDLLLACTTAAYGGHKCSIAHARFMFTGLALAGAAFGWTRCIDRSGSVASLKRSGLCVGKMEGKPGTRNSAECSNDTCSTVRVVRYTALTLGDSLLQTFVTSSELN
jgi:hypothetical protein